jgi:hypothetical protein
MIKKASKNWRAMVLISALLGMMIGTVGNLFVSSAQGDGYYCPAQYETCSDSGWGAFGDVPPDGGSGGAVWVCPVKEISSDDADGHHSCTSTGCKKSSSVADSYWVCAFTPTGTGTKCPPLEACEQQ